MSAPVVVVVDGLVRQDHRCGQHPALGADLDHLRAGRFRIRDAAVAAVGRPGRRVAGRLDRRDHGDLARVGVVQRPVRVPHRGVGLGVVELQVDRAVIAGVQDPEAVRLALHLEVGVGGPVDQRRVHERFRDTGRRGRAGRQRGLPRRVDRIVVGVGDRAVRQAGVRRPEPWTVVPAAHGAGAGDVARVLVRHVDVREPQAAQPAPGGLVPGRVLGGELSVGWHERLVLDDQRYLVGGDDTAADQPALDRVL